MKRSLITYRMQLAYLDYLNIQGKEAIEIATGVEILRDKPKPIAVPKPLKKNQG